MPLLAREQLPIPSKDYISFCHDGLKAFNENKQIYVDCADPSRSLTAKQVYSLIRKLVAGFRKAGIKKGDCVCIHAFNSVYYPVLVQGIVGAGGVFVGTNPGYTPFELKHALKLSKTKLVITESELVDTVSKPAEESGLSTSQILLLTDDDKKPYRSWSSLLTHGEEDWVSFDDEDLAKNTTAFLMFTSGTSGLPKAAEVTHRNLICQHIINLEHPDHQEPFEDRRLYATPAFHIAVASILHISPLRLGRPAFIMPRFELESYLTNIGKFDITMIILAPPLIVAILAVAKQKPDYVKHCFRNLKKAACGAAPLDVTTQVAFSKLLPQDCTNVQGWGMTEASGIASFFYWPENDQTGSIGRFLPTIDMKLVDDNGQEVGPYGARGEVCLRGPTMVKGYLDNPETNSRDWDSEGFFHTGDIMYGEENTGLFYVVDRKKELIKVRAFQVAPSEIEGVLLMHPDIHDAAVIGLPGQGTELPKGFVVKRPGSQLTEKDVKAWVGERLSSYKKLEGGVEFVEAIPKSPSGKILKKQLREEEARRTREAKL